jgi:hypothetical protein
LNLRVATEPQRHRECKREKEGERWREKASAPSLPLSLSLSFYPLRSPALWLFGSVAKPKSILIEIEDVIEPAFAFAFVVIGVFPIFVVMLVIIVVIPMFSVVGDPG